MFFNDFNKEERNVIPRFRDFSTTLLLGELSFSNQKLIVGEESLNGNSQESLNKLIDDWRSFRSLGFASDLTSYVLPSLSGIEEHHLEEIESAANFILEDNSGALNFQRDAIRNLKERLQFGKLQKSDLRSLTGLLNEDIPSLNLYKIGEQIRTIRLQLKDYPSNPIAYVELSRLYAILGLTEKAVKMMDIAIGLNKENRYILRAAAKLYLHAQNSEKAHFYLRRLGNALTDPWLLSAEIAVATELKNPSRFAKKGLQFLKEEKFGEFESSELSSALGTLELAHGSRLGRKLVRKSLIKPTDNSMAQADWLFRRKQMPEFAELEYGIEIPRNYEYLAFHSLEEKRIVECLEYAHKWKNDQPFSIEPEDFIGSVNLGLGSYKLAVEAFKRSLELNSSSIITRNNLAFAYAKLNKTEEAEQELSKIDFSSLNDRELITLTATKGLVQIRKGNLSEGRKLYQEAIDKAKEKGNAVLSLKAKGNLGIEELRLGNEKIAKNIFEEISRFSSKADDDMFFDFLMKSIKDELEKLRNTSIVSEKVD